MRREEENGQQLSTRAIIANTRWVVRGPSGRTRNLPAAGPPWVVALAVDLHEHLVEMPSPLARPHTPIRRFRISAANVGPNRCHQQRTALWLTSIPRSCSKSSTLRSDSGKRMYIMTARRMISRDVLKYLNGQDRVIDASYLGPCPASSQVLLTRPLEQIATVHNDPRGLALEVLKQSPGRES